MPFIEIKEDLNEDYEDKPVPEGEYDLRIIKATDRRNKADTGDITEIIMSVEGDEGVGAANIFHYLTYPSDDDDSARSRMRMRFLTLFLKMFGVPFESNGFNTEDLVGCTATGLLTQEEYEGRVSNKLKV